MNKFVFAFVKSHIKRAIYELEVANKLKVNCVELELINQIKNTLTLLQNEQDKGDEE